jgi:hypothetical protein
MEFDWDVSQCHLPSASRKKRHAALIKHSHVVPPGNGRAVKRRGASVRERRLQVCAPADETRAVRTLKAALTFDSFAVRRRGTS